jgi:hypothetical protein
LPRFAWTVLYVASPLPAVCSHWFFPSTRTDVSSKCPVSPAFTFSEISTNTFALFSANSLTWFTSVPVLIGTSNTSFMIFCVLP